MSLSSVAVMHAAEISVKGKVLKVPAIHLDGKTIIITGRWLRKASIQDEAWIDGELSPCSVLATLKGNRLAADLFTFAQKLPETQPKYSYYFEWDNYAVIDVKSYADWWEKRLPQESRRNVRLAAKRGVVVRVASFDEELVRGISQIYNETPMRQGRPFWHYGKAIDAVRRENATFAERSEFIGAYYNDELIGFIKMVYVGQTANIMQILSKNSHQEKKVMNALIAKAVEVCEEKRVRYLLYLNFVYGSVYNALSEFKRRNGFEQINYPRYYIPLTVKGGLSLKLGVHRGLRNALPAPVVSALLAIRRK